MFLAHTADVRSDRKPSVSHPYGVGIGIIDSAPGREMSFAGIKDGRATFRMSTPDGVGSRAVTTLQAGADGVFAIRIGTVGDALTLKVDYESNGWHVERSCGWGDTRTVDPSTLIGTEARDVKFYVSGILDPQALAAGPSLPAQETASFERGSYRFRPTASCDVFASAFEKNTKK